MTVSRICNRSAVVTNGDETILVAAKRMARLSVGTLIVTDRESGNHPIGIVTDRDVVVRCVAEQLDPAITPVSAVMTVPVKTVREDTPIETALTSMASAGTRRLAVTNEDDELVGVLALDDVIELLVEEAETIGRLLTKQPPVWA
ncbi:MAG: CBS domain-containing protein [Gemmatimonadota bacterium]